MGEIIFVHPDKSYLPELEGYKSYFEKKYKVCIVTYNELKYKKIGKGIILWFFMGFYPRKYQADFIVHDYRSLSVGMFPKVKDWIKKYFNHKPDLRIFLNKDVCRTLGFNDKVPFVYIDMGVPGYIKDVICLKERLYDFVYVGEISKRRKIDLMLRNFIKEYGDRKTIILVGDAESSIKKEFSSYRNIIFTGKLSHKETLCIIAMSEIGVSFVPELYPYSLQTATKMLEYASLQKKIIASKTNSNIKTAEKYKIKVFFVDNYSFPSLPSLQSIPDNINFDYKKYTWNKIIEQSGLGSYIEV